MGVLEVSEEILKKLLYKVDKMECKIASAASLNGGFDKLLSEVEHIKESQGEILQGLRGIKKSLYEPDSGLFSRVKELESESARRWEYIVETKPIVGQHQELLHWRKEAQKDLDEVSQKIIDIVKAKTGGTIRS